MKAKEQKLALIDELIERLNISREDVIKHLQSSPNFFSKTDYANIKLGMFWYEDDTFSFDRIIKKKIKAIVELIEDGIIYGNLTASEIFNIREKEASWYESKEILDKFSYPCGENEEIILYTIDQLQRVRDNYDDVKDAFDMLNKPCRSLWYWSSSQCGYDGAKVLYWSDGKQDCQPKTYHYKFLPVLALKVK